MLLRRKSHTKTQRYIILKFKHLLFIINRAVILGLNLKQQFL